MLQLVDRLKQLSGAPGLATPAPEDYAYRSMYHWVLDNGIAYDSRALNGREWRLVKKHVHYSARKECFANCQRTVLEPLIDNINRVAEGLVGVLSPFSYVEGYALCEDVGFPLHHGWLLLNGKVVDPTLRIYKPRPRKYRPELALGAYPKGREYYGAVIPWRQVAACVKRTLSWHTVLDDPENGYPLLKKA